MARLRTHNRRRAWRMFKDATPAYMRVVPRTPKVEEVTEFVDWGTSARFDFATWRQQVVEMMKRGA